MTNEGIITSKDGLTMPSLSLVIWIATSMIYSLIEIVFGTVDYVKCTFVTSLLLSVLCGFTVINSLLKDSVQPVKLLLVIFNIVLLFSSANGYQAGYAFQAHNNNSNSHTVKVSENSNAFILPFLDPRPWLPTSDESTDLKKRIKELENELMNANLREQKLTENLTTLRGDSGKSDSDMKRKLEDQQNIILRLTEENNNLRNLPSKQQDSGLKNEIILLKQFNQQLVNEITVHNLRVSNFSNCLSNPGAQKNTAIYLRNLKEFNCRPYADTLLSMKLRTSF